MERYKVNRQTTPIETFNRIKASLIRPHSNVGLGLVDDLAEYVSTLDSVKRDNIIVVELTSIVPPNNLNQVFVLEVLEYISWLDTVSNVLNSEKIKRALEVKHHGIIITNEHIMFINNLLNTYHTLKLQNNIQTSLLLIGYELNLNLVYFWNFS